ncbi:MAG: NADH-quinone oxidoreductase subunit J [Ilumatobacter sp.]
MIAAFLAQLGDQVSADNAVNVAQNVGFGIIATVMIFAAFSVVTTKNVVHAALWLVLVLAGVAAQYILAAAEFVAVSQVMVYIGAVMVLFLFGIMLTRAQIGSETGLNNQGWQLGIPVAIVLFGLLAFVVLDGVEDGVIADAPLTGVNNESTTEIADRVLFQYLAPFFGMTFVLLAAAIGAIVLARKD